MRERIDGGVRREVDARGIGGWRRVNERGRGSRVSKWVGKSGEMGGVGEGRG